MVIATCLFILMMTFSVYFLIFCIYQYYKLDREQERKLKNLQKEVDNQMERIERDWHEYNKKLDETYGEYKNVD